MGAPVSLQGRFCHNMDPDSSILVSSLGYTEIDQGIEFQWGSSFWFDMDSTLFVSVTLSGFTDTNWDHLHGLELRVD